MKTIGTPFTSITMLDIDDVDYSISLDLYTRNARSGAVFLLHQSRGTSSVGCIAENVAVFAFSNIVPKRSAHTVKCIDREDNSRY